ncbi:hypothetical protein KAT36_03615 [Candidatus Pacearchaeota archaeon]|nr:hypothetical protein [Candidatus Pacearchaeota archaeon]
MDVKRFLILGMLGMFLISMMGGVLADGEDYSEEAFETGREAISFAGGFFNALFTQFFGEGEQLTRFFFALLLGMIIYSVINTLFKDSSGTVRWIITGSVTALALLGLPAGFLEAIRTQYSAMGATILTIIPFIIVLVFSLKSESVLIARVTWIFYAFYYLAMYFYIILTADAGWLTTANIPYLAGFFAGAFIFFVVGRIRGLIFMGKLEGLEERGMSKVKKRKLLQRIQDEDLGRYAS